MSLFVMPLCKEFVRLQYFPHSIRTAVYDMTTALRGTLVEIIRENGWIGDISKANALAKVDGMKQLVGYPDWITNDTILEDKFKNVGIISKFKCYIDYSYDEEFVILLSYRILAKIRQGSVGQSG